MLRTLFINIAFIILAYDDYCDYRIKNRNVLILAFIYILIKLVEGANQCIYLDVIKSILLFIISQMGFIFLSFFIDVPYGDSKVFGLYLMYLGIFDGLISLLYGSLIALFPLSIGAKRVPMAVFFYAGYLMHFFLNEAWL